MSKVLLSCVDCLLCFNFACFYFLNNYVMVYIILFKPSTVNQTLEVGIDSRLS